VSGGPRHARARRSGGHRQQQPAEKHNAANDAMDARLFAVLAELERRPTCARSCGAATGSPSPRPRHERARRPHGGHRQPRLHRARPPRLAPLPRDAGADPVALKGWVIADPSSARCSAICACGESAKMRLPELMHGVIPTRAARAALPDRRPRPGGRPGADRPRDGRAGALRHGIVSRVVPDAELDATCLEWRSRSPGSRRLRCGSSGARSRAWRTRGRSLDAGGGDLQTLVQASEDYAEMKAARAAGREPKYRNR